MTDFLVKLFINIKKFSRIIRNRCINCRGKMRFETGYYYKFPNKYKCYYCNKYYIHDSRYGIKNNYE